MKYRKPLIVFVALLALGLAGCAGVLNAIKETSNQSKVLKQGIDQAIASAEETIDKLPPGSVRDALAKQIEGAKKTSKQIGDRIAQADKIVADLEKGVVGPELVAAATAIPGVGPYVPALAVLLPSIIALVQSGRAGKFKNGFVKVVQSWQQVGADLTKAEKDAAAEIQGEKVTALVHKVKAKLDPEEV